jgi:hypothetical protein
MTFKSVSCRLESTGLSINHTRSEELHQLEVSFTAISYSYYKLNNVLPTISLPMATSYGARYPLTSRFVGQAASDNRRSGKDPRPLCKDIPFPYHLLLLLNVFVRRIACR